MQRPALAGVVAAALLCAAAACQSAEPPATGDATSSTPSADADSSAAATDSGLVEFSVEDFAFAAPPRLRSGWNTFRMTNTGEQPHFMQLWQLPEGHTFDGFVADVATPFQAEFDRYVGGETTQAEFFETLGALMPQWFYDTAPMGGVGFTAPGLTSETALQLEAGDYVMECYVISPDDEMKFHGVLGMLRPLIVTDQSTGQQQPAADVRVTLTNFAIEIEGELTAGEHTIAVHAAEGAEGLVQHDLHLARLSEDDSLDEFIAWMSWVDGIRAPAPVEFLGGVDHLPANGTGTIIERL